MNKFLLVFVVLPLILGAVVIVALGKSVSHLGSSPFSAISSFAPKGAVSGGGE